MLILEIDTHSPVPIYEQIVDGVQTLGSARRSGPRKSAGIGSSTGRRSGRSTRTPLPAPIERWNRKAFSKPQDGEELVFPLTRRHALATHSSGGSTNSWTG